MLFIACDHEVTDWSNTSQVEAGIAAGKITLISGVKPQMPAPSPVEVEASIGCGPENELLAFDFSLTWIDRNYTQSNTSFYNQLNKYKGYLAMYLCNADELVVNDKYVVTFQAAPVYPPNGSAAIQYEATAAWRGLDLPDTYTAPDVFG